MATAQSTIPPSASAPSAIRSGRGAPSIQPRRRDVAPLSSIGGSGGPTMGSAPLGLGLVAGARIQNLQGATPTKQRDAGTCHPVRLTLGPAGFIRMGCRIDAPASRQGSSGIRPNSERRAMERGVKILANCIIVPPRVSSLVAFWCAELSAPLGRRHALDVHEYRTRRAPGGPTQ